jgi:hypothetical protein
LFCIYIGFKNYTPAFLILKECFSTNRRHPTENKEKTQKNRAKNPVKKIKKESIFERLASAFLQGF